MSTPAHATTAIPASTTADDADAAVQPRRGNSVVGQSARTAGHAITVGMLREVAARVVGWLLDQPGD